MTTRARRNTANSLRKSKIPTPSSSFAAATSSSRLKSNISSTQLNTSATVLAARVQQLDDAKSCISVQKAVIEKLEKECEQLRLNQKEALARYELALARDGERLHEKAKAVELAEELRIEQKLRLADAAEAAKRIASLESHKRSRDSEVMKLRAQLEALLSSASDAENCAQDADQWFRKAQSLEAEVRALRNESESARQLADEARSALETLKATAAENEKAAVAHSAALRRELDALSLARESDKARAERGATAIEQLRQLQQHCRELEAQQDKRATEGAEEREVLVATMRAEIADQRRELAARQRKIDELTLQKLEHERAAVLEEKMLLMRSALERAQQREEEHARVRALLEQAQQERERLAAQLSAAGDNATLRAQLEESRQRCTVLMNDLPRYRSECDRLKETLTAQAEANAAGRAAVEQAQKRNEQLEAQLDTARTSIKLLEMERDGLNRVVKSFNVEATEKNSQQMQQRLGQLERGISEKERKIVELNAEKSRLQARIAGTEQESNSTETQGTKAQIAQLQSEVLEKQRKIAHLQGQLTALQEQFAACEQERIALKARIAARDSDTSSAGHVSKKRKAVSLTIVDSDEEQTPEENGTCSPTVVLTRSTSTAKKTAVAQCSSCAMLQREKQALETELSCCSNRIAELEHRVGRGDYDSSTTKVLHMRVNPETWAAAAVAACNSALDAVDSVAANNDNERESSLATSNEALRLELAKNIEEGEKRVLRLKEVFKRKIREFRSAVFHLFGYQIDVVEQRYTLKSPYMSNDQSLIFEASGSGQNLTFSLTHTEYSATLKKEIRAYLEQCHSIPAFLAHLITVGFESSTFVKK